MIETLCQDALTHFEGASPNAIVALDPLGATLFRRDHVTNIESMLYEPLLCLVLQGAKHVQAGAHGGICAAGSMIVVSHSLPVVSQVTDADADAPYLALIVPLDVAILRGLMAEMAGTRPTRPQEAALTITPVPVDLLDTATRLLRLARDDQAAALLAPILVRELHARLLLSPIGPHLSQFLWNGDAAAQIARAIDSIRASVHAPLAISDLAAHAGMSRSSFHTHFKNVTGQSPIQYQKDIRLLTAQDMVLQHDVPISEVAYEVGYESPAQFSRDYARKFGVAPRTHRQEIRAM